MIHPPFTNVALWIGIAFCIAQTGIFSGPWHFLASASCVWRLRLLLGMATPSRCLVCANFTLATILWGNVATNVLLTLLFESVLAGVGAFVFSTVAITFLGEIIPQAYFSRNALRIAARFAPFLKFYQVMLFAVAKPTALFLNWWLGPESIALLHERDFRALLSKHVEAEGTDVGRLEATGALNFLDLDDIAVLDEGEPVDPRSIISLPVVSGWPVSPVRTYAERFVPTAT
jgi:metal transporter CNNM